MSIKDSDRRMLWVRAGGRCTLCKVYLLEGNLSAHEVPLGEAAHVVGRTESPTSPRGADPLPVTDRDSVDNLLLACSNCHTEIDQARVAELLDVDFLRAKKREHEADIRLQTGLLKDRRTAVVRVAGEVRGDRMELPRQAATEAVIRSAGRFPWFVDSYDRQSVEIDLQGIPGEHPVRADYYATARARIDQAFDSRIGPGIENGDITHLSVFAIARLPLLVYLGARLDDGFAIDIYQRHRASESWVWPDADDTATFEVQTVPRTGDRGDEGVLIVNLSGTTSMTDLPGGWSAYPVWVLESSAGTGEDVIDSRPTLAAFEATVRVFFTQLESTHKHLKRLHIVGAIPVSAAIALGRVLKSEGLRPTIALYDRSPDGYQFALEV